MSFPSYPHYCDSGIAWLGPVPEHWEIRKVKHVADFATGGTPPTGDNDAYSGDNLWANISDLGPRWLTDTAKRVSDAAVARLGLTPAPIGSLLYSFKLSIGQVSFAGCEMYTNEAIATFMPSERLYLPYAYYALPLSLAWSATENIYGAKLLNQELIRNAIVALPPFDEQVRLAKVLDEATSEIDQLIAEQQRLFELLAEKRQAVISRAVTKGLDPQAAMKSSGIEWMGSIPAHWKPLTLGRLTLERCDGPFGSGLKSDHYVEAGARVIRLQNIRSGYFDGSDAAYVDLSYFERDLARHSVLAGDLLLAGLGDDNHTVGRACVAPVGIEPALVKADCFRFRLDTRLALPAFVAMQLSAGAPADAGALSTGSTRSRIPLFAMSARMVALPPLAEQQQIVAKVAMWEARAGEVEQVCTEAIQRLHERRTALISAAVTGKIDVRNFADAA